jgi:hypothetical protein
MDELVTLIRSLDRCPHGRHEGDACAGHHGPGMYDGGCLGGFSLGNPFLQRPGGQIGTDVHGGIITMNDLARVSGTWHEMNYGVRLASGEILIHEDDKSGARHVSTQAEAEVVAREHPDPMARVVALRVCTWVDAVRPFGISDESSTAAVPVGNAVGHG